MNTQQTRICQSLLLIVGLLLNQWLEPTTAQATTAAPIVHIVQAGDTLSAIAQQYGTSVQALLNLNGLTSTVIYVGQHLTIVREPIPGSGIGTIYTVVRGDTLAALAQRFNTTVQSIMQANGLHSTVIEVGQQLAIPRDFPAPPPEPGPLYPISYVVQRGDSLAAIAHRYDTTVAALQEVNGLHSTVIYVGQRLTIPIATLPDAPNIPYIVQSGDTLAGLAQRYEVSVAAIMATNGLTVTTIYVGQVLLIPHSLGYPSDPTITDSAGGNPPEPCMPAEPTLLRYADPEGAYCLLFPSRFHLGDQAYGRSAIYGPALDQSLEPLFAALVVIKEGPANGTTLAEVVNIYVDNNGGGESVTRQSMTLGGEAAIVVEGLPGRTGSRQLFTVHAGQVYHLSLYPVDPAFPQVAPDVEALWQAVTGSFTFTG